MVCSEARLVAFLAGDLPPEQERRFDEHLLCCEACWQAVQADRTSRAAIAQLREVAPSELCERVSFAVSLAERRPSAPIERARIGLHAIARSARRPVVLVGAAALVVSLVVALTVDSFTADHSHEPPQLAAVVAMAQSNAPPSTSLRSGEEMTIGHQAMLVRAFVVGDKRAFVATSTKPFPMPTASHLVVGSSTTAWMATQGSFSMYGVNRAHGEPSMFVVAKMPMAELPAVAAALHLI